MISLWLTFLLACRGADSELSEPKAWDCRLPPATSRNAKKWRFVFPMCLPHPEATESGKGSNHGPWIEGRFPPGTPAPSSARRQTTRTRQPHKGTLRWRSISRFQGFDNEKLAKIRTTSSQGLGMLL